MLYNTYNIYYIYDKYIIYKLLDIYVLYNLAAMVRRISLSEFRFAIRKVVHDAENGAATILTHYQRDIAAIVPMSMLDPATPPDRKSPSVEGRRSRRDKAS